jgi:membrane associated rhomboid family serine protease
MGFSDRHYDRFDSASYSPEWTAVMTIIVVNVAIWVANLLAAGEFPVNRLLALEGNFFEQPWKLWELVTYGFTHDGSSPWHLVFNMLALWFFGRVVEEIMGRAEFYRFYLLAIVISGLAWLVSLQAGGGLLARSSFLVGASGAIMAVLAVFIWHFPKQMVLIWGVLPVPAWALGVLYFLSDVQGAASGGGQVANVAHLAGAIFGAIYAWRGLDLGSLFEPVDRWLRSRRARRQSLKVVRQDDDRDGFGNPIRRQAERRSKEEIDDAKLQEEVDRILEKISRSGESSLSESDRDTLGRASRRLKEKIR